MIPKRIIQTARTRELTPFEQGCQVNLQLLHPEWEYVFFDDQDIATFVATEYPEYKEIFYTFSHSIQRIDFFRYLAVHRLGGFYFDLDVLLYKSLDPLLNATNIFSFEELTLSHFLRHHFSMDWEIGNFGFGAEPGGEFLSRVIKNCVRAQQDRSWLTPMMRGVPRFVYRDFQILNSTGPGLLSRTLSEDTAFGQTVTVLFPPDVCNRRFWHRFGDYGIHVMQGSWRTKGGLIRRRVARFWEGRLRRRQMSQSLEHGPIRKYPGYRGWTEGARLTLQERQAL